MNVDGSVVRIFWDNSNLFHAAQNACDKAGIWIDQGHRYDGRLRFDHVVEFAAPGRRIGKAVAVGSMPPGLGSLWENLRRNGVNVDTRDYGADSGNEQAVDEVLKLEMLRSQVDVQIAGQSPAVAVLLTDRKRGPWPLDHTLDQGRAPCRCSPRSGHFCAAPCVGAVLAWPLVGEQRRGRVLVAFVISLVGVLVVGTARHHHVYTHEMIEHAHALDLPDTHHRHER